MQAGHGAEQLTYLKLPALPYAKTLAGVQLLFLDANHPDSAQATATRHHFVGIEISGSTLTLTTVAWTGEVLDTAVITR
ncbi:MAG: hypothetical protein MUP97_14935 [Acidimicrobiia bacterium]|nr:hypothetical protein [Acidimicrobiia bacterium]